MRFVTRSIRTGLLLNNIISIRPELPSMHFFVSYRSNYWFSAQNSRVKEQLVVSLVNSEQFYSLISRLVEINQWSLNCNRVWFWHSLTTQWQEQSFSSAYFFGEITSNFRQGVETTGPTWALALGLALRHAPEVVGITEAAAVKEMLALLTPAVIVIAWQQASAGAGGLRQMTRGLIVWEE